MEDYTYDLDPGAERVLGAHMLEVCPSIAAGRPTLEIHPLGIGGKEDPVRLVFNAAAGPALNASLIDLGNRFRLLVNEVTWSTTHRCPSCPWRARCGSAGLTSKTACAAWIHAGGAHHTGVQPRGDHGDARRFRRPSPASRLPSSTPTPKSAILPASCVKPTSIIISRKGWRAEEL